VTGLNKADKRMFG